MYKFGSLPWAPLCRLKSPAHGSQLLKGMPHLGRNHSDPSRQVLAMVEAMLYNPGMEFTESNYRAFAKIEAVIRGSVYAERVRLFAFEAQAEPLDDMREEIEVAS